MNDCLIKIQPSKELQNKISFALQASEAADPKDLKAKYGINLKDNWPIGSDIDLALLVVLARLHKWQITIKDLDIEFD